LAFSPKTSFSREINRGPKASMEIAILPRNVGKKLSKSLVNNTWKVYMVVAIDLHYEPKSPDNAVLSLFANSAMITFNRILNAKILCSSQI
jgi:hypothetical protein